MNTQKNKRRVYLAPVGGRSLWFRFCISFCGILCILMLSACAGFSAEGFAVRSNRENSPDADEEKNSILSISKVQASSVTVAFSENDSGGVCMAEAYDGKGTETASVSCEIDQGQQEVQLNMEIPATPAVYKIRAFFTDSSQSKRYESEPVTAVMYSDTVSTSRVSGIFIAPNLSSKADAGQWQNALLKMRDIGIDTIIVQYCFQHDPRYGQRAFFPYAEKDTYPDAVDYPQSRNQIEYILSASKNAGIQVYLGLQIMEYEWFEQDMYRDSQWLHDQYELSLKLADSLWNIFGAQYGDILAGWYLPFEFESSEEYESYYEQIAQSYYSPLTSALKNRNQYGRCKIMISPLMYQSSDLLMWQEAVETILSSSMIDVIAPQDGIGYGTQNHDSVGAWFCATRNVVNKINAAQSKKISLWANCENYACLRNSYESNEIERKKPMSISKFITSMDSVVPYVDKLVTFSIHRWDTSLLESSLVDVNVSYYEAYKRYSLTGRKPVGAAEGYYVDINAEEGGCLRFHDYAQAGLTDGFAAVPDNWSEYKGISTENILPFFMEILFDDPIEIQHITSNYYEDINAGIILPRLIKYEYLIRSGDNDEVFTYREFYIDKLQESKGITSSSAVMAAPVMADGVRITVFPGGKWTFIDDIFVESNCEACD